MTMCAFTGLGTCRGPCDVLGRIRQSQGQVSSVLCVKGFFPVFLLFSVDCSCSLPCLAARSWICADCVIREMGDLLSSYRSSRDENERLQLTKHEIDTERLAIIVESALCTCSARNHVLGMLSVALTVLYCALLLGGHVLRRSENRQRIAMLTQELTRMQTRVHIVEQENQQHMANLQVSSQPIGRTACRL